MTSLLDIGPMTESVAIGGKTIDVFGLTPEGFFYLLEKFPLLQKLFGGGASDVTFEMMTEIAPSSSAYAISLATTPRDKYKTTAEWQGAVEAAAKVAVNLPAVYQMTLFQVALRLTFPDGIGPFMQAVTGLATSISRVSGKTVPATASSKRSRTGFVADSRGLRLGPGAPRANSRH